MEHLVFTVKCKKRERRKAYDSPKLSCLFILIVTFSHSVTTCREDVKFDAMKAWCYDNGNSTFTVSFKLKRDVTKASSKKYIHLLCYHCLQQCQWKIILRVVFLKHTERWPLQFNYGFTLQKHRAFKLVVLILTILA